MKTKREMTRRKIISSLLDGQERMQEEIATKVGESEDYISPIIKGLNQEGIIERKVRKSPKTYKDRKSGEEVTKDYLVKFCKLDESIKTFRLLAKEFLRSEEKVKFMKSKYVQSTLTNDFLKPHINKLLEMARPKGCLHGLAIVAKVITSNPEIFRRFPIALYYLLFLDELEMEVFSLKQLADEEGREFLAFWQLTENPVLTPEGIQRIEGLLSMVEKLIQVYRRRLDSVKKNWGVKPRK